MSWDFLRGSYDVVAPTYQERFAAELAAKPRDRELLDAFAGAVGGPVLDVGCGPGQVGAYVRRPGALVVGLDVSEQMARLAGARLDAAVVADMRALPFRAGTVGGIVAFYSVIHLDRAELGEVLAGFRHVLRPGGRVLLSAHEGTGSVAVEDFLGAGVPFAATLFSLQELSAAGQAAGFAVLGAERRLPYPSEGQTTRLYLELSAR